MSYWYHMTCDVILVLLFSLPLLQEEKSHIYLVMEVF